MNRKTPNRHFTIDGKEIGFDRPTYFIADIAANHDGDLELAKELIYLAAEAGADAAKFQHFKAETIVSDFGFKSLGAQKSHQASWGKSVFDVYKDASLNVDWTPVLKETCEKAGISFFTSPYSLDLVDAVDPYVPAYKIGSGDITWKEIVEYIAKKNKPVILATGASTTEDVVLATEAVLRNNPNVCLMQCNTNYTASLENFKYIQLNVLKTYRAMFPDIILGLSDHTPGSTTVLGAVALGACMIEKHFTKDKNRVGPDHKFSMDPTDWREMVLRTKELELALGDGIKKIEANELETVVLQRRGLRTTGDLPEGTTIGPEHLIALRPCPKNAIGPFETENIVGKRLRRTLKQGEHFQWSDLI